MNNELKADVKCNRCKTYRYSTDFLNDKNRTMKTCKKCREVAKKSRVILLCPHKRQKNSCIECNGSSICEHKRQRNKCIECGGNQVCEHKRIRNSCIECNGSSICEHKRQRCRCIECKKNGEGGASICGHNKRRNDCKKCNDAIKLTIKNMISNTKQSDKKCDRYDANNFIDKCFLEGLIEEYPNCYYEDCKVELQYIEYQDNLATIERLDNSMGHIKSNCVLCCKQCNVMKKSNK